MQTTQQNAPLKRTMKTRHLIMLSLGGVIGTGLFFNTGYIISTTGAAGTLLAYLIGALVVWLVMQCLGELSVAMPETGAFHVYAARYLGPATGYTVAWLYWLTWTVALGSSFTAAGFCMQYWFPQVPVWVWCKDFLVAAHGSIRLRDSALVCCRRCPWSQRLRPYKPYTSVEMTPTPIRISTQRQLVTSFTSVG